MIKRVIFDIDDTLIPWEKEYFNEIKYTLDDLNIKYTDKDYENILQAMHDYENEYYTFDRKLVNDYINKYTKKEYPEKFMYTLTKRYEFCVPDKISNNIINTLEYLKSKYELVILTDWYADQQKSRLEKLGILKYFSNLFSPEQTKRKPFKEAFMKAIGENKPEECVMIGDNIDRDVQGALNAGLKAIYYNPKNKNNKIENKNYYEIKRLEELTKIL